jgi:hypothetical protein
MLTTDASSRRGFGCYWLVIRPGSVMIRGCRLSKAKHRTEGGFRVGSLRRIGVR